MSKLPTREALGQLPVARQPRAPASPDLPRVPAGAIIAGGMSDLAKGIGAAGELIRQNDVKRQEFDTERRFHDFMWNQTLDLEQRKREMEPGQARDFGDSFTNGYIANAKSFMETVPAHLKEKYDSRLFAGEQSFYRDATTFGRTEQLRHAGSQITDALSNTFLPRARATPTDKLDEVTKDFEELVDAHPDLTPIQKSELKGNARREIALSHLKGQDPDAVTNNFQLMQKPWTGGAPAAVVAAARRVGIDPRDLAAVISYETGGTFNPDKWGGKGGKYLGLIQFGPNEQRQYGVRPGMSFTEQLGPVAQFLIDRGVKPGMGLSEIYRTVNGGNPNAPLTASDGNGTIAQHIQRIQRDHYTNADRLLTSKDAGSETLMAMGDKDRDQALTYARQQSNMLRVDERNQLALLERQERFKIEEAVTKYTRDIFNGKMMSARDIVNDPVFERHPEKALAVVRLLEQRAKETDKDVTKYGDDFHDLFLRVHAPPGDPNRITDRADLVSKVKDRSLTVAGFDKLGQIIDGRRTPEGAAEENAKKAHLEMARSRIKQRGNITGMPDPEGDERYGQYTVEFMTRYEQGKKAGFTPQQLLDKKSPHYVGTSLDMENGQYIRSQAEIISDIANNAQKMKPPQPVAPEGYKSLDELVAAYKKGLVSRDEASRIAIERGWAREEAPPRDTQAPDTQTPVVPQSFR